TILSSIKLYSLSLHDALPIYKKERILNEDTFNQWLQETILRTKGSYIIQRYIHTRTKMDEPYHIRAHVQKNGEGKWELVHIYSRDRKSTRLNSSHVSISYAVF